jgi:hypothetical protein
MSVVFVHGGLGNQLFNIAFIDYLQSFGIEIYANKNCSYAFRFAHSSIDYFSNIFQFWNQDRKDPNLSNIIHEHKLQPEDWVSIVKNSKDVSMFGCYQNYEYILPGFIEKLNLTPNTNYPTISETVFLHIRGGDYVNNAFHDVKLETYYKKAISEFPKDTYFSIFTNDIPYAKTIIKDISYTFIEENELDSLYLMSQCSGGICSNSTFAWWGAYLNKNRKLILPSKWFNDTNYYTDGFYFPECTIIEV